MTPGHSLRGCGPPHTRHTCRASRLAFLASISAWRFSLKLDIKIPEYHVVEKGDNIYRIAEKYHIFEEDILAWNTDLNPNTMRIGQKINLKKLDSNTIKSTPPKPVESLSDEEVKKISEKITVNGAVFHHVVKGDTLYNICKRYNVTEEQLKKWNNLDTINIQLDQKLQVSE